MAKNKKRLNLKIILILAEALSAIPSHRALAVFRGRNEGF